MEKRVSEDNLSKLQKTWRKERESIAGKKKNNCSLWKKTVGKARLFYRHLPDASGTNLYWLD
jgi:uncharacterized cupin superfamily protein